MNNCSAYVCFKHFMRFQNSDLTHSPVFFSVRLSHSVVSDSMWPHELQHTRLLCPSPTPRACSDLCPSSQWCHPTISSSVIPFSSVSNKFQCLPHIFPTILFLLQNVLLFFLKKWRVESFKKLMCRCFGKFLGVKDYTRRTSLVAQCWRICLAMQSMKVWSLVGELRSHMLQSNQACVPQLLSQYATTRSLCVAVKDPTMTQWRSCMPQLRPNSAK